MTEYWWILLAAAGLTVGIGASLWLYTAIDLTRVVSPSARWLAREARFNTWGIRLMALGAVLAAIGAALAVGRWLGT
jgi:hypothetical protein